MNTETLTLAEFLLERIAEDEAAAFGTGERGYFIEPVGFGLGTTVGGVRLRAECEAKRRIVIEHSPSDFARSFCRVCSPLGERFAPYPCDTLRFLAAPYADHPDFREEWL